jgi:hypothetical protein
MHIFLDIRTLTFINGTTALAMFTCMLHVARNRKIYPGFSLWRTAFMAICSGLILMSTRNVLPDAVSILMANCMNQLGAILICRGLARFSDTRQLNWLDSTATVTLLIFLAYFTYIQYDVQLRTGFITSWLVIFYFRAAWLARWPVAKVLGHTNWLLVGSLVAIGVWLAFYAICAWFIQDYVIDLMHAGIVHGLTLVIYLGLTTIAMTGLISINSTRLENDLTKAREEINSLREFLPICANCKKIRDDQGYWQQVDKYLNEHAGTEFTHSICPDCMKLLYPELKIDK